MQEGEDTAQFKTNTVKTGDTIYFSSGYIILNKVTLNPKNDRYNFNESDTALMAELSVRSIDGTEYTARPVYYVKNNQANYILDTVSSQGIALGLSRVVDGQSVEISVKESSMLTPFIALKILEFPFINLLWIGTVLMVVGFGMSIIRRIRLQRTLSVK